MKNGAKWRLQTLTTESKRLKAQINKAGADPYALKMWEKAVGIAIKVCDVPCAAANIIKQEALSSGVDAVVSRGVINCSVEHTDVIILGNVSGVNVLITRLKRQPFALKELASGLEGILQAPSPRLKMRGKELDLTQPVVMGILNVTPDSFSDGGSYMDVDSIKARIDAIIAEGAAFIDIGAVSTKPGYVDISADEELRRIMPAVKLAMKAAKENGVFVSIDSWRYEVLKECIDMGIDMINDQSGLMDIRLADLAAQSGAAICIMHNNDDREGDMSDKVASFLVNAAEQATAAGVDAQSIVIDPGFGFVKDTADNFSVLHYLQELCSLSYPVLAGVSRKSMIGNSTGRAVAQRSAGTVAAETLAILQGAAIIRTHDVGACVDTIKIVNNFKGGC